MTAGGNKRNYKDYLSSCNINDVSPRVLRRLQIFPVKPRKFREQFEENFKQDTSQRFSCWETRQQNIENDLPTNDNNLKHCSNDNQMDNEKIEHMQVENALAGDSVSDEKQYAEYVDSSCDIAEYLYEAHEMHEDTAEDASQRSSLNNVEGISVMDDYERQETMAFSKSIDFDNNEVHYSKNQIFEWDSDLYADLTDNDNCEREIIKSRNLKEFMSSENFLNKIDIPVNKSRGEIFLMALEHCLRFRSSFTEISSQLQMINSMFSEPILPETRYALNNILNSNNALEYHGICPKCCKYIGKINEFKCTLTCEICEEILCFDGPSSINVFIVINPMDNIRLLIEENDKYYEYIMNERKYDGVIKDVYDGRLYRSFKKELPPDERYSYVTAIFNTDGAPRFESSQYSIWPIYLQINEIPIEIRHKRIIMCGIWFGRNKPEMTAFLQPFIETMVSLSKDKIKCRVNNKDLFVKLYVLICCVDSVARAPIQGLTLFNGYYGCNWCLHRGEWYKGSMRYPIILHPPEPRNNTNMCQFMKQVARDDCIGAVFGVKYVSPVINLPYFNIGQGFVPDYMHCCLAGVGKQITMALLNSTRITIEEIDDILLKIKAPTQIGRASRSFKDVSDWKAKEWENFILYYSVPIFRIALSRRLFNYWILFVDSLYILLKSEITPDELNEADKKLYTFVFSTEKYFSKAMMTFNIHQLLHISESVMNWGPLYCHSTFPFESANHNTLQAIFCAKGVNQQIVRYINLQNSINSLRSHIYPYASPVVLQFIEELSTRRIKRSFKLFSVTYLGSGKIIDETISQNSGMTVTSTLAYQRIVKDGCLFASLKMKNLRSDNSFAMLSDKTFIRILYFLVDNKNSKEMILCHIVNTSIQLSKNVVMVRSVGSDVVSVPTKQLEKVCIFIQIHENSYIITLPNLIHY